MHPRMIEKGMFQFVSAIAFGLLLAVSYAQEPFVPREWLEDRLRRQGDRLVFCIHKDGLTAQFDRSVASQLADVLLLEADFYEVVPPLRPTPPLDYRLPLTEDQLFLIMTDRCEAFMNFSLAAGTYPEWMMLTRSYYRSGFVLAVTESDYEELADIPFDQPIGSRMLTSADIRFATYLHSLAEGSRWQRFPYPDNQMLLERLVDGTVAAALIWEPALDAFVEANAEAEGIQIIGTDPFQPPEMEFGIALRARDSFLRTLLDEAIVAIIEDGAVEQLLEDHSLPGRPGSLGP